MEFGDREGYGRWSVGFWDVRGVVTLSHEIIVLRSGKKTGKNIGKLKKGYKYSGKRLKSGVAEIIRVKKNKKIKKIE